MPALFYEHDERFSDVIRGSSDARLPAMGISLILQPKAVVQVFADAALSHIAAMQLLALEA